MHKKTIRAVGAGFVAGLWLALALLAWFGPKRETSLSERRKLAQFPQTSAEAVLSGAYMSNFEAYTLDQFPMRDSFRQLKAQFHYNILQQRDNNGIYLSDGFAAKLEYPLQEASVNYALGKFNELYEAYLKDSGSSIVFAVVPDKNYYLSQKSGGLAMNYEKLFAMVEAGTPWAYQVDLSTVLELQDYYRTDTHWRQEALLEAAGVLCKALDTVLPDAADYRKTALDRPFYGVYYGQAALPMEPEIMYVLNSDLLDGCRVYNYETESFTTVYDMEKLDSSDLYDVFLSGAAPLLRIENPAAQTDKELLVFRDSFGSSITPLLVQGYRTVTLVDTRYIAGSLLENYIDFHGQDVLFLYSSLILNSSSTLK